MSDTVAFVQEWLANADYDPTQFDKDFAAAIDARCKREARLAFCAGWWVNAGTPGEDGAGDHDYFDGCERADWQAYSGELKVLSDTDAAASEAGEVERMREALVVFAACARDLDATNTPDDEWAKFRLLASDYRRAYRFYVSRFGEPPYPEDARAALTTQGGAEG